MATRIMLGITLTAVFYFLIILSLTGQAEAVPEIIPREVLFGNPVKAHPTISPNGKMLAYLAPVDGVINVWVRTLGQKDDRPVTRDTNRGITSYTWAQDSAHIFFKQDTDGDENWRLYWIELKSGAVKAFTPFKDVQARIIFGEKNYPNDLLISLNKRDPAVHDLYHLQLPTGELTLIEENPGNFTGWIADSNFKVRGATIVEPDGGDALLFRETEESEWKKIITWNMEDAMTSGPHGFTKDGRSMYLTDSRGVNTGRLTTIDLTSSAIQVIAEDPDVDVSSFIGSPDTYEIQMVMFTKDRTEYRVLDPNIEDDIQKIRELDEGDFFVMGRDNSLTKWLVGFVNDDGPVNYYLYDATVGEGTFLFSNQPALEQYALSKIEPISYKARDGLTIHGYLTLPRGVGRFDLPLVLLVHGGPWVRDGWGYNPRAQWLANRGYACLQVNYRGSTGYGKAFVNAGDKEWGGKMHDDLVDGIQWIVDQGVVDPQRMAIFGGSYGGYASLVGATFTPDLFKCAISVVGPSNLKSFIESVPPYWKNYLAMIYKRVGNPNTEEEFLKSRSPLFKVDQIKIPMLIAQGANDPRVKRTESEQIVEAMKKKGIDHEYLIFDDEGHGFAKPENRLEFYAAAEKFLAKHLGGRYEE